MSLSTLPLQHQKKKKLKKINSMNATVILSAVMAMATSVASVSNFAYNSEINNGKVGVPVNFFIQPSYKKTDLAKCLLSFAVECTLEKEVRLFEMAVPKESVGFYMELGFVQMELVALQAYIKHDA